jgi:hypothetical protein
VGSRPNRTAQRKKRFLDVFGELGIISRAAEAAGVGRTTVYEWQEHDEHFSLAFRQAEIRSTEVLESEARRRAVDGVEKERRVYDNRGNLIDEYTETSYSDTLLIFLLKARDPNKYRERLQLQHADADGEKFPLTAIRKALGIGVADEDEA